MSGHHGQRPRPRFRRTLARIDQLLVEVGDLTAAHADRHRSTVMVEGGMIMAEAVMIALAPHVDRARADDLVHAACVEARALGAGFGDTLQRTLGAELLEALGPLELILDPAS